MTTFDSITDGWRYVLSEAIEMSTNNGSCCLICVPRNQKDFAMIAQYGEDIGIFMKNKN